jgi:hypothetical protein
VIPGVSGRLVSTWFVDELLLTTFAGRLGEATRSAAFARFTRWWRDVERRLGPASSLRAIGDLAAEPLLVLLGFTPGRVTVLTNPPVLLAALGGGGATAAFMVTSWQDDLAASWRAVRRRAQVDARWALAFNGTTLRLLDAQRPYATHFLEFDLEAAAHDERAFAALWGLLRAEPLGGLLEEAIEASRRHAAGVCRSLRDGVLEALQAFLQALLLSGPERCRRSRRRRAPTLDHAFEQALTIVYRILFLLFAEARGLVPVWQPIYRDAYTIERLRDLADGPGDARGLWESLQAITRLAASGCHVGDLIVTAFNGRLFSPARTPLGESCALDDEQVRQAVRALSSRSSVGGGRERIAYRDLDVEQLGAVYESVLDYVPRAEPPPVRLERAGDQRKSSGSFYTPRAITDYLVRRTLSPLVRHLEPDALLRLRVVDPAMGSGAFLVAACRYLARRYEMAILDRGDCLAGDIGPADRSRFRRLVAQHCLFGVDANPTAVQLARLSLWLATLAADRPLTFLDHHLAAGDSLIGASLDDLARQPPGGRRRAAPLPLFELDAALDAVREALPLRLELASTPDDSADIVHRKERTLARLGDSGTQIARWKAAADLWCAAWFVETKEGLNPALFGELTTAALGGTSTLPPNILETWENRLRAIAAARRFFHWTLEFPEVFFDERGSGLPNAGFDAVIGNPPWEMLRADSEQELDRATRRDGVRQQLRFLRGSGQYHGRAQGHPNLYQLFIERALTLVREGGRIGLVVPAGLFTDQGSAALRARLLDRCAIDTVVGMDNRAGIFPIHRSTRFLLLTAAKGETSRAIACRFHETDPAKLDAIPDESGSTDATAYPIVLTRATIDRIGGSARTIPLPRCPLDLLVMEKLARAFPPLADADGWGAHFGRELNATDDRHHFGEPGRGMPVVEGKQIAPFAVDLDRSRHSISRRVAANLPHLKPTLGRARLAYRDVAGASNRLTLIAAVLPADCVTTHTVFCLKTPLDAAAQAFLCALLNSLVLNYLVRQRVMTHVTTAVVHELPVPRPPRTAESFRRLVDLAQALCAAPDAREPMVALQAAVARLYGLTADELRHLLSTFPLLDREYLDAVHRAFCRGG